MKVSKERIHKISKRWICEWAGIVKAFTKIKRGSRGILNVSYAILKVSKRWILGGWTSAGAILKEDPQEKKEKKNIYIYIQVFAKSRMYWKALKGIQKVPKD